MTPLDPMLAAIADQVASAGPSLFTLEAAIARALFDRAALAAPGNDYPGMQTEARRISTPGGDMTVRFYRLDAVSN